MIAYCYSKGDSLLVLGPRMAVCMCWEQGTSAKIIGTKIGHYYWDHVSSLLRGI
jgi:hypothetical protein